MSIERDADLFVAGEYPERGLTVTEEDIARLAQSPLPIPVYVEHQPSRFQLGEVISLQAVGRWLRGRIRLLCRQER